MFLVKLVERTLSGVSRSAVKTLAYPGTAGLP